MHVTELYFAVQVSEIENAELTVTAKSALSMKYGINQRCPFGRLEYYDTTKCFMHDLMHVVNEGVLNLVIAFLLKSLILDPVIKLDLNIVNYNIANLKSDREFTVPPQIRKNEVLDLAKLSFSSSEIGSLGMCLAIVLAEFVSSTDPKYGNFLLLLEIISSLQCYSFTENELIILEKNIELHNRNHVFFYPKVAGSAGKAITPKLHTLLHFPSQIRLFVPPRYSWCFRYESKNARFKKIMRRNCNFRNVPWSFCAHHQKLVGLDVRENGEGDFFGKMERFTIHGHHSPIHVKYAWWAKYAYETSCLREDSNFQPLKTLTLAGRLCSIGTVFLRSLPTWNTLAVFYRIAEAIIAEQTFLIMEELNTVSFCLDRFSFIVNPKNNFIGIPRNSLVFYAPLYSFYYDN